MMKKKKIVMIPLYLQRPSTLPYNNYYYINNKSSSFLQLHSSSSSLHLSTHHHDRIFSLLKSASHLAEPRRIHALLIISGFFKFQFHPSSSSSSPSVPLASELVHLYLKFNCPNEALLLFHRLPNKNKTNIIAWNSIFRSLVHFGYFSHVLHLYQSMLSQSSPRLLPDNYTYPLILKACSALCSIHHGRMVLQTILSHSGFTPNVYVYCALVDMFAKCGSLGEARMLFEDMPHKDLASWTAIICGSVHNREWLQALLLFKRMRFEGTRPDSVIVAAVLPACGRMEAKLMGMTLQGCSIRGGFDTDLFVSNVLIDMYCKCGDIVEARFVFNNMAHKDVISWSTLIAGYSQNSQYWKSIEMYLEMKASEERTNAVTAASVLPAFAKLKLLKQGREMHNYILKQGFDKDIVVGSALIDMYASCGLTQEAGIIFKIMSDKDITLWNSMIVGYASNEDFDSAVRIFQRIWESQLKPNSITLVSIVPVCTKVGALKQGREIHGYATRSGLGMTISVGNSILDMYCKCGCLDLGVKVFGNMLEKNVVTYNTIISAHGIHGHADLAFSSFYQMKASKVKPNKVTFVALLSACSHMGLVDKGWSIYHSMMNEYGLLPDMEHYSCMVDLLGRAGHIEDACNFITRMPVEPDSNVLGSLLGACRVHNRPELADIVGRQIIQKERIDASCHILLSNICASTGRWEDASKYRNFIKEKRLIKKAGKSCIQIGHHIYTFKARDETHPHFGQIQEILEVLLLDMKNEMIHDLNASFQHGDHDVGDGG